ncbi:MAG: hypothetical protein EPO02_09765 [Nitrospirae bacterium]|nr:MAG: hypothetical protein EPO02_09765 [Nitrospirota bacterium]
MSSSITIGFRDRTHVCIQTEFTPPLADDERRELLIHAAMLTGRAFASLSPERQGALAGVLREWVAARFGTCPLQLVDGDPMACPQRFVSTFLAPPREYALATIGCDREEGGIDYFLPMAAAAYLRQVAVTDRDPEELLKPSLALCAAVAIHPVTVDNHFQMATASIPKIEPVFDRTVVPVELVEDVKPAVEDSKRRLLETRRSLIVSACLAALLIVLGVQYLSTRDPKAGGGPAGGHGEAPPQAMPTPAVPPPRQAGVGAHGGAPLPEGGSPSAPTREPFRSVGGPLPVPHPVAKPPSPEMRAYLRKVRDLAENSLAQVEVMLAVTERAGPASEESADTLEHGIRQLRAWKQQFTALSPPRGLARQHSEVDLVLTELGGIARLMRARQLNPTPGAIRDRMAAMHDTLTKTLNDADTL